MSRTALVVATGIAVAFAVGVTGYALMSTLRVSARTDAELPRILLSDLKPGTWKYAPYLQEHRGQGIDVLLVRDKSGRLFAWLVAVKDGQRRLPDQAWWRPGYPCELEPNFESREIACNDTKASEWSRARYRWKIDGTSQSSQVPDMEPAQGVEESGHFVVGKSAA
jgi:hypothetical protein